MTRDEENTSYLVEHGMSFEEIQRYIKQGISLEELRDAVENLEAKGDRRFGGPAPLDSVKPPDYSDAGNAAVFKRAYQNDLIFVDALGWLYWNGQRWERDDHKATAWALILTARMLKEALARRL